MLESVGIVYYFSSSSAETIQPIMASSKRRLLPTDLGKVVELQADLSAAHFGLVVFTHECLLATATTVIHATWLVNFALPLSSFEPHLRGPQNLVQFALSTRTENPSNSAVLLVGVGYVRNALAGQLCRRGQCGIWCTLP